MTTLLKGVIEVHVADGLRKPEKSTGLKTRRTRAENRNRMANYEGAGVKAGAAARKRDSSLRGIRSE